jgi:RHS repeat-associated protein
MARSSGQRRHRPRKDAFRKACLCRFHSHPLQSQPLPATKQTCLEGPFGELLRATGPMAKANPFRFSTKFQDHETEMLYYGYRYYNASTGRWFSRDPIGERGAMNIYGFVRNEPIQRCDKLGLNEYPIHIPEPPPIDDGPDVQWSPASCPKGQITSFIQVAVGFIFAPAPHVDNGGLGNPFGIGTGCPLYPLPVTMPGVFQDSPSGLTGDVYFTVCKVCLEPCVTCKGQGKTWMTAWPGFKIVSKGPCVSWTKGKTGDLSEGRRFVQSAAPPLHWDEGMNADFPYEAKGGCFRCYP